MTPARRAATLAGAAAAPWIEAAARTGLVEAQLMLGQRHLDGDGVPRDPAAALRWFQAAATADYPPALNMEARCHERGWGTEPDPARAAALYRRAAEAGLDWAQFNLANLLLQGQGVPRDRPAALRWFRRAAAQGHPKALNMLGRFLEQGWATPPNPAAALQCYARAARGGDFRGQFNLASLLAQHGRHDEARHWLHEATAHGSPDFLHEAGAALAASPDPAYRAIARAMQRAAIRAGQTPASHAPLPPDHGAAA